jgi:hypothetical protein
MQNRMNYQALALGRNAREVKVWDGDKMECLACRKRDIFSAVSVEEEQVHTCSVGEDKN